MSVLTNHTTITFHNDTDHFLEVTFSGEQNSNLTIFQENSNVITKDNNSLFDYLLSYVWGKESKLVHVNIPLKNTTVLSVKCNANLHFQVKPKISKAKDVDDGFFIINTDYQNNPLEIKFTQAYGVGYDEKGDVCINFMQPVSRDLVIKTSIFLNDKKLNIDCNEAFCKMMV